MINCIEEFISLCKEGYSKGWHERNGGNLSYHLMEKEVNEFRPYIKNRGRFYSLDIKLDNIADEYFLVTGSGKYFSDVEKSPEDNIGLIKINAAGDGYEILWGLNAGAMPTSELPTHLLNHEARFKKYNSRVIYHAHTTNLIAMTFIFPLNNDLFTRLLWEMATECPIVFPNGIGIISWMVPGSKNIGIETAKIIEKYDVVLWAHHGTFCSGANLKEAFGLMETVEKSAEILMKILSTGRKIYQSIKTENFIDLANEFKVNLSQGALDYSLKEVVNE